MAVMTKSRKPRALSQYEKEEQELVAAFETAFVKAGGAAKGAKVGPVVRARLIEYFERAVAPQLKNNVVAWEGPVRTFVLHCMSELGRSVARDPQLGGRLTRARVDQHTREHRPRWESRCPMPPMKPPKRWAELDPKMGWACLTLVELVGE